MSDHICQFPHPTEKNCVGIKREDFRKYHGVSEGWSVSQKEAIRETIKDAFRLEVNVIWSEGYELLDSSGENEVTIEQFLDGKADSVLERLEAITKGEEQ